MEKLNKKIKRLLTVGMIFIAAIPLSVVVFGIAISSSIIWLAPVSGATMVISCYFASVIMLMYAKYKNVKKVIVAVVDKNANSVSAIAAATGQPEITVKATLLTARRNGWLHKDYYIVGERLANGKLCENLNEVAYKCECCGAPYVLNAEDKNPRCPYCGAYKNSK